MDDRRHTGQRMNTEAEAATYAAQAVLIMAGLRIPTMRYETLDDSPMGGRDGFGLWSMTSTADTSEWRAKPEVASVGNLLRALLDPGPAYVPAAIQLSIVGNVQRAVTGKRDGTATAWLWVTGTSPVQARVTDSRGHPDLPGHQAPDPGARSDAPAEAVLIGRERNRPGFRVLGGSDLRWRSRRNQLTTR